MSVSDPADLKRKLRAEGFQIFRTAALQVTLAERVRDNLIMDSGVAAALDDGATVSVRVTVRAQASHFPGAGAEQVWVHARNLAKVFIDSGYEEEESRAEPVPDPNNPSESLDTSHEILLRRNVDGLDALFDELRAALTRVRSTGDE